MNSSKLILLVLVVLQPYLTFSQTLWCPKSGISGYEIEAHKAKTILTSNTSDLQKMEAYVTVKEDNLYIQSNYAPEGAEYPFKISTNQEVYDMKDLLKYLIDPENVQQPNSIFDQAYRNDIVLNVEASVLSHPRYKNLEWDGANNVRIVDGADIFETEVLPNTKQRVAKVNDHVYVDLNSDDACEMVGKISKIKDIIDKLYETKDNDLKQDAISTNSSDEQVQNAVKQSTYGRFFSAVASSGLTLVNFACEPAETTKDIVFDAFKKGDSYEQQNVDKIILHLPDETVSTETPTVDNTTTADSTTQTINSSNSDDSSSSSSTGLGKGWYLIVGILVILGIRAIAKNA